MSIATKNKKAREWLVRKMMAKDVAEGIIDMDDIAFGEGLGPKTTARTEAWDTLVGIAEEVAGRKSDYRRWRDGRKKTT